MADEKKVSGKTRAGGAAKPFPWEEAIAEQYERTKSRLKGLATEPEAELQRILEQYLPKKGDSREERLQKLEDLAMGFAGTTIGKGVLPTAAREQGLQKFLEPSAVKRRMYHGTNKDFSAFGHEHQYTGEGATASGSGFYFTESPESASRYALMKGIEGANVKPVYLNIKNPLHFDWGKGEVTGANINLTKKQVKEIIESAPNIRDEEYSPLTNWGDIRGKNFEKTLNEAVKSYADSSMLAALRNDFFLDDHEKWLRSLNKATGYDSATTVTPTGERHYIAWFPEQIKSATGNRGTYDITKPDITKAEGGLAQYGLRHSGEGVKGKGYFGPMAGRDGTVTELSAEDESGEFPLVVPTLTAEELDRLLAGGEPTPEMLDKASSWAATRRKRGESPFASPTEVRMPRPKAEGGSVNLTDLPDEVNPSNWREHLQNNVLADAQALLGVKDGGVINLDELIEKSLKKKDGGVINLDELIDWTLAKDEHRKMKAGGAVKMADGGQTFPLQRPEEVTDLKPRPRTKRDELLEMLSKGVGSVHEFMAKPFGYENPPGEMVSSLIGLPGAAKTLERMAYGDPLTSGAGMTTNLLPETTEAAFLGLGAAPTALKMTKNLPVGMSIKPTTTDLLDLELANKMKASPTAVVPEAKAGKVKAPANPVGFYNPAEKAALNLQRKKGPGSAFISDLKKQPNVTDERIAELGLTDLASNPNVTREEVIAAVEQNRIPLRESVKREPDREAINKLEEEYQDLANQFAAISGQGNPEEVMRISAAVDKNLAEQNRLKSIPEARFGPSTSPDYSMPGGENYREIRVALPQKRSEPKDMRGYTVKTVNENPVTGQRDIEVFDPSGNRVSTRYGFSGNDSEALMNIAESASNRAKSENNFYHSTHHGDEPNVLFHLRVADHVDEEGKRGLLIDELQSDWHQQGREKGYGDKLRFGYSIVEQEPGFFLLKKEGMSMPMASGTKEEIMDRARHYNAIENGVPDAPFKDNWYQLGLKRAIKEAVDTGMDRVYLTTGARQADRYDLSKQLSRVSYQDGVLHGYDNSGALVVNKAMTPDELPNYVGKDLGKKMVENAQKDAEIRNKISVARYEGRPESEINALRSQLDGVKTDYAGVDLKVGGEGMKQYYDKNYKNYLEKYAKQHGGKLGMTHLKTREEWPFPITIKEEGGQFRLFGRDPRTDSFNPNLAGRSFDSYDDALKARDTLYEGFAEPVYYIDLTDAMRESAKKGQSYADGGGVFNTDPDITDAGRIIPEHTI